MKHVLTFLVLFLLLAGCGQRPAQTDGTSTAPDTSRTVPLSHADSIDAANNQSLREAGESLNKAYVFLSEGDSNLYLRADMHSDHRFFGYAAPDTSSARLFLLSVYTSDVEGNPFDLPLGAFYDTDGMDQLSLKYASETEDFVQLMAVKPGQKDIPVFVQRQWIEIQ